MFPDNRSEEENVPSIDALETQERRQIHAIPSYFGVDDEEEIPDMAEYKQPDNAVDIDAVSNSIFQWTIVIVIKLNICLFLLIFLGCEYSFLYCKDLRYVKSYEGGWIYICRKVQWGGI